MCSRRQPFAWSAHHLVELVEADAARLVGVDHLEEVEPVARLRVREDVLHLLRAAPRQLKLCRLRRRLDVCHAVAHVSLQQRIRLGANGGCRQRGLLLRLQPRVRSPLESCLPRGEGKFPPDATLLGLELVLVNRDG